MSTAIEQSLTPDLSNQSGQPGIDDGNPDRLIDSDLSFFIDTGLGRLLRAMLRQSLIDIIDDRKNERAPAEVSMSSRWPTTDAGRSSIEFLMPSVSSDSVIARIYQAPDDVLHSLNLGEKGQSELETLPSPVQTLVVNGEDSLRPAFDGSPGALSSDDAEDRSVSSESHPF